MGAAKLYQIKFDFSSDICRKNHKNNDNSNLAHDSIKESKQSLRNQILTFIRATGDFGATCEEIENALSLSHQCASARCSELKALGLIFESGGRRTKSGRRAAIHHAFKKRPEEKI